MTNKLTLLLFAIVYKCRALYFTAYSQAKQLYNGVFSRESPAVHLSSAITAGMPVGCEDVPLIKLVCGVCP